MVKHIGESLRERGYFYAQNVDVLPAEYIKSIYEYSNKAHSLPVGIKKLYTSTGAYSGLDVGVAELDYEAGTVSTARAWDYSRKSFTLAKDQPDKSELGADPSDLPDKMQKRFSENPNTYPGEDVLKPSFSGVLDELYERQNHLASALMVVFAEMFDLPSRTFSDMFYGENQSGDLGTIRLINYPGSEGLSADDLAKANIGISPHTDFEAFTLMHQDAPGLQFIPASGEGWIDAPVRAGEFVVIVGDVLERFTNGVLRATPHRVAKTSHKRMSIIRFNAVNPDVVIKPLPQFVTEERPAAYSWVTMGTHMTTTMQNLAAGLGAWDAETQTSKTATYVYVDGIDHRQVDGAKSTNSA